LCCFDEIIIAGAEVGNNLIDGHFCFLLILLLCFRVPKLATT